MKGYDAYLFDMDGTVSQTLLVWLEIVQATLAHYNIVADQKVIVRKVFGNAKNGLSELGVPDYDLPEVFKEWDKRAAEQMRTMKLYPDVDRVLAHLKQSGKKLALITATVRPTVEVILTATGLQGAFDVIVTGDEISAHKPDPEGILRALDELGVVKERAVMLGDSEKDIRAAHNAEIDSVLFYPPEHDDFHSLDELQADSPTYTIRTWQEMLEQLQ